VVTRAVDVVIPAAYVPYTAHDMLESHPKDTTSRGIHFMASLPCGPSADGQHTAVETSSKRQCTSSKRTARWMPAVLMALAVLCLQACMAAPDAWQREWTCQAPMYRILDTKFFSVPFRFNGKDVQCASLDGRKCWSEGNCTSKLKQLARATKEPATLTCGEDHRKVWGFSGYEEVRHWCHELDRFYANPAAYCKTNRMLWDPALPGCQLAPRQSQLMPCRDSNVSWSLLNRCKSKGDLALAHLIISEPSESWSGWDMLPYGKTLQTCVTSPRDPSDMSGFAQGFVVYSMAKRAVVRSPKAAMCQGGEPLKTQLATACLIDPSWTPGTSRQWHISFTWSPRPEPWGITTTINSTRTRAKYTKACDAGLHPDARRVEHLWVEAYRLCSSGNMLVFVDC
jgi:hypothetical protein